MKCVSLHSAPDLQLRGPGAIKMWRPLLVKINLGYENNFLLFLLLTITKNTSLRRYFREANVSIKSIHFISVLWRLRGDRPIAPLYIRLWLYYNITLELDGTGMKTKRMWVGYMIKFVIRATSVSKSFHLKRYTHSCENDISSRKKVMCCGFTSLSLGLQWKRDFVLRLEGDHKKSVDLEVV
jgi:hypothetical protein